jgi:hypothetical protein
MPKPVESLHDASDASLWCRDLGHAWLFVTDYTVVADRHGVPVLIDRRLRCGRCGCERSDSYHLPAFDKVGSRTVYPEGYLVAGGRVGKPEARAEAYRRSQRPPLHLVASG